MTASHCMSQTDDIKGHCSCDVTPQKCKVLNKREILPYNQFLICKSLYSNLRYATPTNEQASNQLYLLLSIKDPIKVTQQMSTSQDYNILKKKVIELESCEENKFSISIKLLK